jgi:beta-1,4-mannosyltransferase
MSDSDAGRRITVLEAFRPGTMTNPYLLQLVDALDELVDVRTFSWSRLLSGRYDVLHLHWPEVHLEGRTVLRTILRRIAFVEALAVARVRRRAVVRTLHNAEPHEQSGPVRRSILRLCDRWTTEWITLTPSISPPRPGPTTTIPLGHYQGWYPETETRSIDGRVLFFGLIRRYKGVEDLIEATREVERSPLSVRIIGRCDEPRLAATVAAGCLADERIEATLEFVPDRVLAGEIQAAEIVVLPFRVMANSSSVLLSLSLSRPVLVPRSTTMEELAEEVGEGWILMYDGDLSAQAIVDALDRAGPRSSTGPDLSRRGWGQIASAHVEVFRRAANM